MTDAVRPAPSPSPGPPLPPTASPPSPAGRATAVRQGPPGNELFLVIAGQKYRGWQAIRVTRGVERMPSDFDVQLTERYPVEPHSVPILPGDVCQVLIGNDLVLTGYVDRYLPSINANDHTIRVMGRSACCDLVDCSVIRPGGSQFSSTSVFAAATDLSQPYGVTVRALNGNGPVVEQINVLLGETPFEIIERMARWAAMLVYDDPTGNLVLAQVGTDKMASGMRQGKNVLAAQVTFTVDERFAEYHAYMMSMNSLADIGSVNGNELSVVKDAGMVALRRPDGQPRLRQRAIITEQLFNGGGFLADARAKWEAARRYGRSQAIQVVVDNWRDEAGRLWEPNTLTSVHIPSCKAENLTFVISEVSYLRSERGTEARLLLMPPDAFRPEPTNLYLLDAQISRAVATGTGAQPARPAAMANATPPPSRPAFSPTGV